MDLGASGVESAPVEAPVPLFTGLDLPTSFPETGVVDVDNSLVVDDSFFIAYDRLIAAPYPEIGVMDRDRIRYCVRHLRTYPSLLLRTGKNPFIHPQAYQPVMPQALQDAVSASALYLSKNEANESMVWEIIASKVTQLLEPRGSWSVAEHLTCLQALIIFQIIRLFDEDIKQRSDAEQQEDILTSWTERLAQRTGAMSSTYSSSDSAVERGWDAWVFEEVVSRTIIISRMVQAMFSIQKQGFCTLVGAVTEMSFTAQRALWEAKSAMHFVKACRERRRFFVERMEFSEVLERAKVGEVDDMGMLMLVTYKGVDGVNEWIVRKGNAELLE